MNIESDRPDEQAASIENDADHSATALATWLLDTLAGRWSEERTLSALVAEFGMSEADARRALHQARDGVIRAIGGRKANRPDAATTPVAHEAFDILWCSFNQNEFFATGRAPSRQWLDWYRDFKAQQSIDAQSQ